jgi:hypothetical protein
MRIVLHILRIFCVFLRILEGVCTVRISLRIFVRTLRILCIFSIFLAYSAHLES